MAVPVYRVPPQAAQAAAREPPSRTPPHASSFAHRGPHAPHHNQHHNQHHGHGQAGQQQHPQGGDGGGGAQGGEGGGRQGDGGGGSQGLGRGSGHSSFAFEVVASRPPAHESCGVHSNGVMGLDSDSDEEGEEGGEEGGRGGEGGGGCGGWGGGGGSSPYGRVDPHAGLSPWLRLMAVLLIVHGVSPELAPKYRRPRGSAGGEAEAGGSGGGGGREQEEGQGGRGGEETPSPVASEDEAEDGARAAAAGAASSAGGQEGGGSGMGAEGVCQLSPAVADGACLACYGLMLPLLVDAGVEAGGGGGRGGGGGGAGGGGEGTGALGGGQLRRRLCPLREALATLKTLMGDSAANVAAAGEEGLVPLLVQVGAHGLGVLCHRVCSAPRVRTTFEVLALFPPVDVRWCPLPAVPHDARQHGPGIATRPAT